MQKNQQISPLRQSASIILYQSNDKIDKILMLKRAKNISFGNHVVFPGGVCDKQDIQYCEKIINLNKFEDYSKITAIRELYQQTKILLLPKNDQAFIQQIINGKINSKNFDYEFFCKLWKNDMNLLIPLIRIMTIQNLKGKRFDTIFYTPCASVIKLNLGKQKQLNTNQIKCLKYIHINKQQSLQYFWQSAQKIIQMSKKQQIIISPPQIIILNCLMKVDSLHNFKFFNQKSCYEPILFYLSKKYWTLLGDYQYNFQKIIQQQPESKSKLNYQMFIKQKKVKLQQIIQNKNIRRFFLDFTNKKVKFQSSYKEESLLYYLIQSNASL